MATLLFGLLLLIFRSVSSGYQEANFNFDERFNNKRIFEEYKQGLGVELKVKDSMAVTCGFLCLSNPSCSVFGVNEINRTCLLFGDVMYSSASEEAPGLKYYFYNDGKCPFWYNFTMLREAKMCLGVNLSPKKSHSEAMLNCQSKGGRLVVLEDEDKASVVLNILDDLGQSSEWPYVGLKRTEDNSFSWVNGQSMSRNWWGPNQPDNVNGNENCGSISQGVLWDVECIWPQIFICEIP